jgi:hypothetical protein
MLAAAKSGAAMHVARVWTVCRKFLTWVQVARLLDVSVRIGSLPSDGYIALLCQLPAAGVHRCGSGGAVAAGSPRTAGLQQDRAGFERIQL